MKELLAETAARAARYISEIDDRRVTPSAESIARLSSLGGPLPEGPTGPAELLALLDEVGSHATVATTGGRRCREGAADHKSKVACRYPGRWDLLVRRHGMARTYGHANFGVLLGYHRRRCGAEFGCNDQNREICNNRMIRSFM